MHHRNWGLKPHFEGKKKSGLAYEIIYLYYGLSIIRLVLVGAVAGAVPPGTGREGGGTAAGAMDSSPGGSGRYRPAVARVGGEREARGGRRAGGFGRKYGGATAS